MSSINRPRLWPSTAGYALAGCGLLWASMPPMGLWWLAWIAPIPWLRLVQQAEPLSGRPYRTLWLCSLVYWLVTLQGIRLAHPINYLGWLALSGYLAAYLPVFVGLSRWAVNRTKVSLIVIAPVIWTGLELARAHLLTGFSMAMLAHSQYEHPHWFQIADLGGAYLVSFVLILVAACVARAWPITNRSVTLWPVGVIVAVVATTWGYGEARLRQTETGEQAERLRVALIQSCFNTKFEYDPERNHDIFVRYIELSQEVAESHPDLDLIVWPESVFSGNVPEILVADDAQLAAEIDPTVLAERITEFRARREAVARLINQRTDSDSDGLSGKTHLLIGAQTVNFRNAVQEQYNSALLLDPTGNVLQRYYKMHPVMFGEYIPFGRTFPWIYTWTPLQGLTPGRSPTALSVHGLKLSPSICFESAIPHLIRRQFLELQQNGTSPNVLVNLTHDGWFWGSSILDFQLAGAVFRAVELRTPCLVAANAGISAWIDGDGRIRARGPRQGDAQVIANVVVDERSSLYSWSGDWFSGLCLLATILLAFWRYSIGLAAKFQPAQSQLSA